MTQTPAYSRLNPSPRYRALADMYRAMHSQGEAAQGRAPTETFDGRSLAPHTLTIRDLIGLTGAKTLLDYGAGKGTLYNMRDLKGPDGETHSDLRSYWGVDSIALYDPGYAPYSAYPTGRFDAVISTDVLEHIPEDDIPWVLDEIFGFAEKFVFVTIAAFPARKLMPDGTNAHCTIQSLEWWQERLNVSRLKSGREPGWFALYAQAEGQTPIACKG